MDAFLCARGFEPALVRELAGLGVTGAVSPAAGVVTAETVPPAPLDPAFARQPLPGVVAVEGASVAKLAQAAFDAIARPIDAQGAWTLHALAADPEEEGLPSRAALVGEALVALVKKNRKRTSRDLVAPELAPVDALVAQVVFASRERAFVSTARPRALASFGHDVLARFPGGAPPVPEDKTAPSSAHRKAREAYLLMSRAPRAGERCADLGASPGGWTWTALALGARVLAVDRAPLLPPAAGHANLEQHQGDAFTYLPPAGEAFDWLLCDVIAAPGRTLELLDRWLAAGGCRRFVVNVKFKGDDRDAVFALRALFARHEARARVRHLVNDKNEVTAFGFARGVVVGD